MVKRKLKINRNFFEERGIFTLSRLLDYEDMKHSDWRFEDVLNYWEEIPEDNKIIR